MFVSKESRDGLAKAGAGLDELLAAGVEPADSSCAVEVIRALESVGRRVAAAQAELVAVIDSRAQFVLDGHLSAKVMVRHVAKLSGGEAAGRAKTAKMLNDLSAVGDRFRCGELGVDQVRLLGRVHANVRVRPHMVDGEDWFLEIADRLAFPDFEIAVRQWERLADDDGCEPAGHPRRCVTMVQDKIGLTWELKGRFGSMQGAAIDEILDHYIKAEWLADWEKARADKGDDATVEDLARSAGQRRADALWQIFADAAANPGSAIPKAFVHNIVWDSSGYEEMISRLTGARHQPINPNTFRCSTVNSTPIDPYEAAAASLIGQLRRVITSAASVVIDLGHARCFTGSARLATMLANHQCTHPGCWTPASQCQIDHTQPHTAGGPTNPTNASPRCGHHNRIKEKGYAVWRDPTGTWHTYRPDGTKID